MALNHLIYINIRSVGNSRDYAKMFIDLTVTTHMLSPYYNKLLPLTLPLQQPRRQQEFDKKFPVVMELTYEQ